MSKINYSISKTSFLKFEQCPKAFFLYKNHPYLRDKVGIDKQLTFNRGHEVGFLARELFPGGTDVAAISKNTQEAAAITQQLIENRIAVIYEATFVFNNVLIMADILCFDGTHYNAYEVKSSLKISENYLKDAYLQYFVLKNCLPEFEDLFLVSLNPDYVRETLIEPKKLFRKRSVKNKAEENIPYFEIRIGQALEVLEKNMIPNIAIGKQCFKPYLCDFFGTCWKDTEKENTPFNLPFIDRDQLFEWYNNNIRTIELVTDEMLGKPHLIAIRNAFLKNEALIDPTRIGEFCKTVKTPAIAMDMELWGPAIPQLPGAKCFEQIPFLVCFYDGSSHTSFFTDHRPDARREFASQLIKLSSQYESILVYDKTMEINAINALTHKHPEFKNELDVLKGKMVDVFEVFLKLYYYHPGFKSNFSLKVVSSILLSELSYPKIGSGLEAMNYYERYLSTENEIEKELIRKDLIDYCNTDCTATYELTRFLEKL